MSKISLKHSGGNVVSLNSPTNAPGAADVAFKLPNADGSAGQFMKTDGSGNLSFAAAGGGGKVVQMVFKHSATEVSTISSSSFTVATDLSLAITPTSGSNRILGMFTIYLMGYSNGNNETNSEIMVTDDDQ